MYIYKKKKKETKPAGTETAQRALIEVNGTTVIF